MFWLAWARRSSSRLYAAPGVLWLVNAMAFMVVRQLGCCVSVATLNAWSLGIYLQAMLTLAGIGFYFWRRSIVPQAGN